MISTRVPERLYPLGRTQTRRVLRSDECAQLLPGAAEAPGMTRKGCLALLAFLDECPVCPERLELEALVLQLLARMAAN